jgi:hypothetical protein
MADADDDVDADADAVLAREKTLIDKKSRWRKREVRTLTYDELSQAEPVTWFTGARGGIFRVVRHENGRYTRVYWKATPDQPDPPTTEPEHKISRFPFSDHADRRRRS